MESKQTRALALIYGDVLAFRKILRDYKSGKRDVLPDIKWGSLDDAKDALVGVDTGSIFLNSASPDQQRVLASIGMTAKRMMEEIERLED